MAINFYHRINIGIVLFLFFLSDIDKIGIIVKFSWSSNAINKQKEQKCYRLSVLFQSNNQIKPSVMYNIIVPLRYSSLVGQNTLVLLIIK